jgi:hypothetical protein
MKQDPTKKVVMLPINASTTTGPILDSKGKTIVAKPEEIIGMDNYKKHQMFLQQQAALANGVGPKEPYKRSNSLFD